MKYGIYFLYFTCQKIVALFSHCTGRKVIDADSLSSLDALVTQEIARLKQEIGLSPARLCSATDVCITRLAAHDDKPSKLVFPLYFYLEFH